MFQRLEIVNFGKWKNLIKINRYLYFVKCINFSTLRFAFLWFDCDVVFFFLAIIPIILLRHLMSMNFWWHSISLSQCGFHPRPDQPHCHCSHHKHPVLGLVNIVLRTFKWNAAIRLLVSPTHELHCTGCITQSAEVLESEMVWRNLYKLQLILHRYLH